ncbi:hypothetical protein AZH45_03095 [Corynebacterium striatum]|nr:hypothetical protein AZH45_03095 [Corynebacterium striatum]
MVNKLAERAQRLALAYLAIVKVVLERQRHRMLAPLAIWARAPRVKCRDHPVGAQRVVDRDEVLVPTRPGAIARHLGALASGSLDGLDARGILRGQRNPALDDPRSTKLLSVSVLIPHMLREGADTRSLTAKALLIHGASDVPI